LALLALTATVMVVVALVGVGVGVLLFKQCPRELNISILFLLYFFLF
jgi:hypothetical protein